METISCKEQKLQEEILREIRKLKEAIANGTIIPNNPIIFEERELFINKLVEDYHIDDVHFRAYVEKVFADEVEVE